ncbi:MAG TPA: hypothetical protein VFE16_10800 [Candidatus Cybelea sp.]|jgi:hypothetical protein|nr:hypothetical protein [Candidatus Cybelea sp.]
MKRPPAAFAAFAATVILYSFTGLRGGAGDTCKWFNGSITDRSIGALTHQTDLLYNRIALPPDANVSVGGTAVSAQDEQLVDFKLNNATICTAGEALYGPTPSPAPSP